MKLILAITIGAFLVVCAISIGIYLEKKEYNNGRCRQCGKVLRYFDMDSQGGRGYCCDGCGYHTWVSYKTVDKKHKEV